MSTLNRSRRLDEESLRRGHVGVVALNTHIHARRGENFRETLDFDPDDLRRKQRQTREERADDTDTGRKKGNKSDIGDTVSPQELLGKAIFSPYVQQSSISARQLSKV